MNSDNESALKVAEFLLRIKAIIIKPQSPFTWASGWLSPIYCDNRKTLSHPKVRNFLRQEFASRIENNYGKPDVIAGVATGAIAIGAIVAEALGLPFCYVRSSPKEHGRQNLIEGDIESGQTVVVIEDLISTGGSSLKAVTALKDAGCIIKGVVAIFSYGFDEAQSRFDDAGITLETLTNYNTLIEQAEKENYVTMDQIETLKRWRENPSTWKP